MDTRTNSTQAFTDNNDDDDDEKKSGEEKKKRKIPLEQQRQIKRAVLYWF